MPRTWCVILLSFNLVKLVKNLIHCKYMIFLKKVCLWFRIFSDINLMGNKQSLAISMKKLINRKVILDHNTQPQPCQWLFTIELFVNRHIEKHMAIRGLVWLGWLHNYVFSRAVAMTRCATHVSQGSDNISNRKKKENHVFLLYFKILKKSNN